LIGGGTEFVQIIATLLTKIANSTDWSGANPRPAVQRDPTAVKGRLLEASEKVLYWHTIPLTRTLTPSWELNTR
jgi:hypothetical protein